MRYRVDDLTNVQQVVGWTDIATPAAQSVITVLGTQNQMAWPYRDYQLMQISVEATLNATDDDPAFVQVQTYLYNLVQVYQPNVNLPNT